MRNLDPFEQAYLACALWASTYPDTEEPMDDLDVDDFDPDTLKALLDEARDFREYAAADLALLGDDAQAGHDFWLTRNRHGAGYWDRGNGALGDRLTEAAHTFGEVWLYVGDDGLVYSSC